MWSETEYTSSLMTPPVSVNPKAALINAATRRDVVEGLVPRSGITWLYGASMSFKTFVTMSLAAHVAAGKPWLGKQVERSAVIYVGAEGGEALHIRRAAAELDMGEAGKLAVITGRPNLCTIEGFWWLRGMLYGATGLGYNELVEKGAFSERNPADPQVRGTKEGENSGFMVSPVMYLDGVKDVPRSFLVIIDTYSQTSEGDDKAQVSAYMRSLRDMIDFAARHTDMYGEADPIALSFIVVDHVTKSGGAYLGSVSKLNDVESQIEVSREGRSRLATVSQRKCKDGLEARPFTVELAPYTLDGYSDAYGKPLCTLVARDGRAAAALLEITETGPTGELLRIVAEAGGAIADSEAKDAFRELPDNEGKSRHTVDTAYRRARASLSDKGLVLFGQDDGEPVLRLPDAHKGSNKDSNKGEQEGAGGGTGSSNTGTLCEDVTLCAVGEDLL